MRTNQVMFGEALLLLCAVLMPSLAQQEPNVSSERVNCTGYASHCAQLCPVSTCSKNKTLYIQVRVIQCSQLFQSYYTVYHITLAQSVGQYLLRYQ